MEHTENKWLLKNVDVGQSHETLRIFNDKDVEIATLCLRRDNAGANGKRICLCVNSHDALLAACKESERRISFLLNKILKAEKYPDSYILERVELDKTYATLSFIIEAIADAKKESVKG